MFARRRRNELRNCILSRIPKHSICAEIGVFKGDFSSLILESEPKKLHLIDPWKFETDSTYISSLYGGNRGKNQRNMDATYDSVLRRFRSAIQSGIVEVHRTSSGEGCSLFPDNYFDWIYIDGNHRYEFVRQDLEKYLPKVKTNALVAGDDYATPGWWQDGVTKAVDEAVASGRFEKILIENNQFLLRKAQV